MAYANAGFPPIVEIMMSKSVYYDKLEELKESFSEVINSIRLLSYINTFQDLLTILDRLDILNSFNVETFKKINCILDDSDITALLADGLENGEPPRLQNNFSLQSLKDDNLRSKNLPTCEKNILTESKQDSIYKLIADEIARKWRQFGRGLGLKNGELERIQMTPHSEFIDKIYEMFSLLEKTIPDDDERIERICNALERCRRKDLIRKMKQILGS